MSPETLSVLVVEDVEINLELMQLVLQRDGFQVTSARTATEAMACLKQGHFDVIALDIKLPDMCGLDFARRVKSDPQTSHIPIVAVSAFAMKGDAERALASGCDFYITKPIDTRTLGKTIREYVQQWEEKHRS